MNLSFLSMCRRRVSLPKLVATTGVALLCSQSLQAQSPNLAFELPSSATVSDEGGFEYEDDLAEPEPINVDPSDTEIFRERYADGKVKIEREVTLDAEGNYVNHGSWRMWDPTGLLVAEGRYDQGRRVGAWTRMLGRNNTPLLRQAPFNRFKAPFVSQVNFSDDKMDGEWMIIDMDQRKCSQISLSDGVRHGLAITWLPNGNVLRQSRYKQGVPVGEVLQANNSTGKLEKVATFIDGRRVTSKTSHFGRNKQQKKTEEMYLAPKTVQTKPDVFWTNQFAQYEAEGQALLHGKSLAWHPNGQLQSEGSYDYDKRVGHFQYWHANGQLAAEGDFKNDQYHGQWLWWHENGQKAIVGKYAAGKLIGEWRWWNEMGRLADRKVYDGTEQLGANELEQPKKISQAPQELQLK